MCSLKNLYRIVCICVTNNLNAKLMTKYKLAILKLTVYKRPKEWYLHWQNAPKEWLRKVPFRGKKVPSYSSLRFPNWNKLQWKPKGWVELEIFEPQMSFFPVGKQNCLWCLKYEKGYCKIQEHRNWLVPN